MANQWREAYNQWERSAAPVLEQLAGSDAVRDLLAVSTTVGRAMMSEAERVSRQWLHLWNLPAAGDVRQLRSEVARLTAEVSRLSAANDATPSASGPVVVPGPRRDATEGEASVVREPLSRAS